MKSAVMKDHLNRMLKRTEISAADGSKLRSSRPLRIIACMMKTMGSIPDQDGFKPSQRQWLLNLVCQLSKAVGRCERLVQTPVPLVYGRHTCRFLSVYTLTLPFALVQGLRWLTVPTMLVVTWALFGILEIGHMIEDPFRSSLELGPISWAICRDCERALPDDQMPQQGSAQKQARLPEDGRVATGAASQGTLNPILEPVV